MTLPSTARPIVLLCAVGFAISGCAGSIVEEQASAHFQAMRPLGASLRSVDRGHRTEGREDLPLVGASDQRISLREVFRWYFSLADTCQAQVLDHHLRPEDTFEQQLTQIRLVAVQYNLDLPFTTITYGTNRNQETKAALYENLIKIKSAVQEESLSTSHCQSLSEMTQDEIFEYELRLARAVYQHLFDATEIERYGVPCRGIIYAYTKEGRPDLNTRGPLEVYRDRTAICQESAGLLHACLRSVGLKPEPLEPAVFKLGYDVDYDVGVGHVLVGTPCGPNNYLILDPSNEMVNTPNELEGFDSKVYGRTIPISLTRFVANHYQNYAGLMTSLGDQAEYRRSTRIRSQLAPESFGALISRFRLGQGTVDDLIAEFSSIYLRQKKQNQPDTEAAFMLALLHFRKLNSNNLFQKQRDQVKSAVLHFLSESRNDLGRPQRSFEYHRSEFVQYAYPIADFYHTLGLRKQVVEVVQEALHASPLTVSEHRGALSKLLKHFEESDTEYKEIACCIALARAMDFAWTFASRSPADCEALGELLRKKRRSSSQLPEFTVAERVVAALVAEKMNRVDKARQLYQDLMKEYPENYYAVFGFLEFSNRQFDGAAAKGLSIRLRRLRPGPWEFALRSIQADLDLGLLTGLDRRIQDLEDAGVSYAKLRGVRGQLALLQGNDDVAKTLLTAAASLQGDALRARALLGKIN